VPQAKSGEGRLARGKLKGKTEARRNAPTTADNAAIVSETVTSGVPPGTGGRALPHHIFMIKSHRRAQCQEVVRQGQKERTRTLDEKDGVRFECKRYDRCPVPSREPVTACHDDRRWESRRVNGHRREIRGVVKANTNP